MNNAYTLNEFYSALDYALKEFGLTREDTHLIKIYKHPIGLQFVYKDSVYISSVNGQTQSLPKSKTN